MQQQMPTSMRINKFILIETGTYNDMVLRPYQANVGVETVGLFNEVTQGGTNYSPNAIGNIASQILRPNGQVRGGVGIDQGWANRRIRFMMEVIQERFGGTQMIHVLTGYTDHAGVTASGAVDPNMKLYFNNSISVRAMQIQTPTGYQNQWALAEAAHIIGSSPAPMMGQHMPMLMRPMDVVGAMYTNSLGDPEIFDMRSTTKSGIHKSRRSNGSSTQYLSQSLKALTTAERDEMGVSETMEDIYDSARGALTEPLAGSDPVLSMFGQATSYQYDNFVTYSDLMRLFPEADNVAHFIAQGDVMRHQHAQQAPGTAPQISNERGSTESWNGSNNETIAATILANSVPSLMMDMMMTKTVFAATNRTLNGQFEVEMRDAKAFTDNMDMTPFMNQFINRLKLETLQDISHMNQLTIDLQVNANIMGDTYITVSIEGGPAYDYVMPSFSDALMAPVIGGGQQDLSSLAFDLQNLHGNVGANAVPHQQPRQVAGGWGDQNNFMEGDSLGEVNSVI